MLADQKNRRLGLDLHMERGIQCSAKVRSNYQARNTRTLHDNDV